MPVIKNPSYDPKGIEAVKAQILLELDSRPNTELVTFDQLRTFFSKTEIEWPDVYIAEKVQGWGLAVDYA